MDTEYLRHDPAQPYNHFYSLAMLRSQLVAREAIARLERLHERFPDPDLWDAIQLLRAAHAAAC